MKEIKINRLHLENFKSHRLLDLDLQGRDVTIYGDNATGKTSVYDALTWLLFGKDSKGAGEKNIEIKPLNSAGEVADHQAITIVEAEITVDGVPQTLRRTFRERWSTRRGSTEAVYDGNISDYAIDGVPLKKNAFDAAIAEIVPEDVFRLLTSVDYFPEQMKWQDRRNVLFDMTGTMTDAQVMAQEPRFAALAEGMGNLTLDKYRAKLGAEKKGFTGTRDDAPVRISELQRTIDTARGTDYEAARHERELLQDQADAVQAELMHVNRDSEAADLRIQARALDQDIRELQEENRRHRMNQSHQDHIFDLERQLRRAQDAQRSADWELNRMVNQVATYKAENANIEQRIQERGFAIEHELEKLRTLWSETDARAFTPGNCPTCGQPLPADMQARAMQKFRSTKDAELDRIEAQAAALNEEKANLSAHAHYYEIPDQSIIDDLREHLNQATVNVKALEDQLTAAKQEAGEVEDMPGYTAKLQALEQQRGEINTRLTDLLNGANHHIEELTNQRRDLMAKVDDLSQILAKQSLAESAAQRIEQLKEEQRNATAGLESIEAMLFLIEDYIRFKAQFIEDTVNRVFRFARVRLFRAQANGGLEERCDVTFDGVPYASLNSGMRINVGVDIINALSTYYGVTVPLFVDNAESVTRLETCGGQTVRLVVSESDKELRIV